MATVVGSQTFPVGHTDIGSHPFSKGTATTVTLTADPVGPANLGGTAVLKLQATVGASTFDALVFSCWYGSYTDRHGVVQVGGSSLTTRVDMTGWDHVRVIADVASAPVTVSVSTG